MHPPRSTAPADLRLAGGLVLGLILGGCTSWQPAAEFEGWTLYVQDGSTVDAELYSSAFDAAFEAVEGVLGSFTGDVAVHAITGSVDLHSGSHGTIIGEEGAVERVEGIGDTIVPAFHARAGGGLFEPSGIFVTTPAVGTAVHELVHARVDELGLDLPLWFEEGLAAVMGDGILHDGRWVVDGFAFWPWVELRENPLTDRELKRLLAIGARDDHSVRDNVLVHFVGWTIVFDCLRESGGLEWESWLAELRESEDRFEWARTRLRRTLASATALEWLRRVSDDDPGVRLAAACGAWKVGDEEIVRLLLDRLAVEEDDEVKVCLAVNALASLGRGRVSREVERELWPTVLRALRRVELPDEGEEVAARELYRSYRRWSGRRTRQVAFDRLDRYWRE